MIIMETRGKKSSFNQFISAKQAIKKNQNTQIISIDVFEVISINSCLQFSKNQLQWEMHELSIVAIRYITCS